MLCMLPFFRDIDVFLGYCCSEGEMCSCFKKKGSTYNIIALVIDITHSGLMKNDFGCRTAKHIGSYISANQSKTKLEILNMSLNSLKNKGFGYLSEVKSMFS